MDTTKKYILMSEKAVKLQKRKPEVGDFYAWPEKQGKEVDVLTEVTMTVLFGDSNYNETVAICLLRQDQLQEMLGSFLQVQAMLNDLDEWHRAYDARFIDLESMEQLWLAFVMKEKYNKTWNGKDWINA